MFSTTINLVFSIAPQTQEFLVGLLRIYTPADLAALAKLKADIDKSRARLDLIDPVSQPKASDS